MIDNQRVEGCETLGATVFIVADRASIEVFDRRKDIASFDFVQVSTTGRRAFNQEDNVVARGFRTSHHHFRRQCKLGKND